MARKYNRDNRGRFSSGGGGATARGGRLRTASGGKRATQTMKAEGSARSGVIKGRAARTVAGEKAMGKLAKAPKAAATTSAPKGGEFRSRMTALKEQRRIGRAERTMNTPKRKGASSPGTAAPKGEAFRGSMVALKERRRINRAERRMNTPKRK